MRSPVTPVTGLKMAKSPTKSWHRLILWFSLVILLMILGISGIDIGMNSPRFCASCHVMSPEVATWQVSFHSKVTCTTCHVDSGFQHPIQALVRLISRTNQTLNKTYQLPVVIRTPVSDKICLECHTLQRTITPLNDINIPHAQHNEAGVQCTDCHQGVAHGRIVDRFQTIDGNFDKWTLEFAKQEMVTGNLRIGMKGCMQCHLNKGTGPLKCVGCHEKMILPISHKDQGWKKQHGKEAILDIEACEKCHNYTNVEGKPLKAEGKDVAKYARDNSFCSDCHLNASSPHEEGWAFTHTNSVDLKDVARCLICHQMNQPDEAANPTIIYCSKCHEENLGAAFIR